MKTNGPIVSVTGPCSNECRGLLFAPYRVVCRGVVGPFRVWGMRLYAARVMKEQTEPESSSAVKRVSAVFTMMVGEWHIA